MFIHLILKIPLKELPPFDGNFYFMVVSIAIFINAILLVAGLDYLENKD